MADSRRDLHLSRIAFGGDYNPEQWPESVWTEDMRLMKEAGVSMVSVGIFSWAKVEPRPGEYDFDWFDRVMDNLAATGVQACLATMTGSPPPWLAAQHPEILPVRADGTRLWPGGRQHYCPSSPVYRRAAAALVERLAERYGEHPALALWHINNEYGCHVPACYCDVSAGHFREWLAERYGTVDALNEAWSTAFWSQGYGDWSEILPPRVAPTFPNPAQQLDYRRFSSDALLGCFLNEKEILRRVTPEVPLTTNFVPEPIPLDGFRWAEEEDVVSYDSYPDPFDSRAHLLAGFGYDLMRSIGRGRPWLLMEQAPSAVNWRDRNSPKPPGLMRLWSWQAVAHGADSVLYFQWRQSRGGAEKYHSAMVPHGGQETRIFREVAALGGELASAAELAGTRMTADVALVTDWHSRWGLELDSHPSTHLRQRDLNLDYYAPLFEAGVTCDIAHPGWDLSGYRMVVVPNLYLLDEGAAANLTAYVRGGGHLVVGFFSGIVDPCDRVWPGSYPAPLRELLGLHVEEFWPLEEGGEIGVSLGSREATGTLWSELVVTEGAQAVGSFTTGELAPDVSAGPPAVTRHAFGDGTAWYVATRLDAATMRGLLDRVRAEAGVGPTLPDLPAGVQATRRRGQDASYLLLLNHGGDQATVNLPYPVTTVVGEPADASGTLTLPPRGVTVLREG